MKQFKIEFSVDTVENVVASLNIYVTDIGYAMYVGDMLSRKYGVNALYIVKEC